MKPVARLALSLALTVFFLGLFLGSFDLRTAWARMSAASPWLIALSVAVNLAAYLVRALRWRYLLAPVRGGIGLYNLTSTTFIGFMVSYLVPFRVGEVVRPVLLARRERLPVPAAIATIALERLLDALTVMSLFLVFMLFAGGGARFLADGAGAGQAAIFLRRGVLVSAGFVVAGIPIVALLVASPERAVAFLHRLNPGGRSGPVGRAIASLEHVAAGLSAVRTLGRFLPCLVLSFALWVVIDLSVLLGVRAFAIPFRLTDVFLLMVPLAVGIAVPTPGGVGPYEFLGQVSLAGFWGVGAAQAAAVAITLHAATLVPTIATGLFFMWRDGLRPAEVRRLASLEPAPAGREGAP